MNTTEPTDTAGAPREAALHTPLDYALAYAQKLRWSVIPLHWITSEGCCSCGGPDCRSPGKHPIAGTPADPVALKGSHDATQNPDQIREWWERYPTANIGVAMGAASGLWALDIDPRNGGDDTLSELESQHGALPETVTAITGSRGYHYLFRLTDRKPKSPGAGIDVKGEGGYIVVEPSNHMQGHYAWEGSADPFDGVMASPAPHWLLEPPQPAAQSWAARGYIPEDRVHDLRRALGYIGQTEEDRDLRIRILTALKSTGAGQQAFGIANEWIQSTAGAERHYTMKAFTKTWNGINPRGDIGIESVFAIAMENGWVNTADRERDAYADENAYAIARLNEPAKKIETQEREPIPVRRLPVPVLAELSEWIGTQLPTNYPHAVNHGVLSLACALASRQYITSDGEPCHVYLGITCRTLGPFRQLKAILQRVLSDVGQRRMIRSLRMSTPQAVHQTLIRSPATHYISDDWGQMISFAGRQQNGTMHAAFGAMAEAHATREIYLDPEPDTRLQSSEDRVIYGPALNILTLISEDQVGHVVKQSEIGRGGVEQFLFVDAGHMIPNDYPQANPELPPAIKEHVARVRPQPIHAGNIALVTAGRGLFAVDYKTVSVQTSERTLFAEYDKRLGQLAAHDPSLFPIIDGARRTMRRLTLGLAIWERPERPALERFISWAGDYVLDHVRDFIERIDIAKSDDGELDVSQRIAQILVETGHKGLTSRELTRKCRAFNRLTIEQRAGLLDTLTKDEEVFAVQQNAEGRGRPTQRYVHRRYVKPQ